MFFEKNVTLHRGEVLLPQGIQLSIFIPQVSRNTIRSLLCTVMLSTTPAHSLSSNSVMNSGKSFTLAPAAVTDFPEKKPAEKSEGKQG